MRNYKIIIDGKKETILLEDKDFILTIAIDNLTKEIKRMGIRNG